MSGPTEQDAPMTLPRHAGIKHTFCHLTPHLTHVQDIAPSTSREIPDFPLNNSRHRSSNERCQDSDLRYPRTGIVEQRAGKQKTAAMAAVESAPSGIRTPDTLIKSQLL